MCKATWIKYIFLNHIVPEKCHMLRISGKNCTVTYTNTKSF